MYHTQGEIHVAKCKRIIIWIKIKDIVVAMFKIHRLNEDRW